MNAATAITATQIPFEKGIRPKRLAITIAGAVSLGSYEAGVLWEVLDAVRQHNDDERIREDSSKRIVVDVLTGASAGGMTAIILSQKLLFEGASFRGPYDNPLYKVWVEGIDLSGLQATNPDESALQSLFSSDLIERISAATLFERYQEPGSTKPAVDVHAAIEPDSPLRVGVALSNLNGVDYGYHVEPQGVFEYRQYADQMTRLVDPRNASTDTKGFWEPLRQAAVACGAFPIAFRPQNLMRSAKNEPDDFPAASLSKWNADPRQFTYTDGGVLQNQPLGIAKNLVDLEDEHLEQESRYYLFVSPHAKDDGPPDSFQASGADYFHMVARLVGVLVGQAGFRDWIRAEDVNDRVRLMDKRAEGLVCGILKGSVDIHALQKTASAVLDLLFPPGSAIRAPGARKTESRIAAEDRLARQYQVEIRTLSGILGAGQAFRDSMLAFETAAGLGARDQMRIYGVTATSSELAGAGLQAFLGFFDRTFRDHDYDVGRSHARAFLLNPILAGQGELGPVFFDPKLNPLRTPDQELAGLKLSAVSPETRDRFKRGVQSRIGQMVTEATKGKLVFKPIKWVAEFVAGTALDWLTN
jgi:hypothetical protein